MKKLLVIPIILIYYLAMLVAFPLQIILIIINRSAEWIESITGDLSSYYEDYFMKPFARIYEYALTIMKSDKTIKWMHEASKRLKQGKPIDKEAQL